MRLIDMKRSGALSNDYYKKIRSLGHPAELNVPDAELRKMLGVEDLTGGEIDG